MTENNGKPSPLIYSELAPWFHLLTAPGDYCKEAEFYARVLMETARIPVKEVLEMGSGGGNNASHMKKHFNLTLTDRSKEMLSISHVLNPECEHIQGDMRTLRLDRQFDGVFTQDAVSYLTTEEDLSAAFDTAFTHCRPGGIVLFCPDFVRETFSEFTDHGGHNGEGRALRYLEWAHDPDPGDTSYIVDMAYILREGDDVNVRSDVHHMGVFPTNTWQELLQRAGFVDVKTHHYPHRGERDWMYATPLFTGIRPE